MCAGMEFNVLPVAGGLYDQHPRLLAEWEVIFRKKAVRDRAEQEQRESEMAAQRRGHLR